MIHNPKGIIRFACVLILFTLTSRTLWGQTSDNEAIKVDPIAPITAGEKFDLIFQRNVLLANGMPDSVPVDPTRSGSISLGFSYGIPLGKFLAFKFEPRMTWHTLHFSPTGTKTFPSVGDSLLVWERQRNTFLETAAGFKLNLVRNAEDKVKLFLEAGAFGGYQLGNWMKVRREADLGSNRTVRVTSKYDPVENTQKLRYGLYGRFGTNWIALVVQYRMSDIFRQQGTTYLFPGTTYTYPKFSKLEIGVTVKL